MGVKRETTWFRAYHAHTKLYAIVHTKCINDGERERENEKALLLSEHV